MTEIWLTIITILGALATSLGSFIYISNIRSNHEKFVTLFKKMEESKEQIFKVEKKFLEYQIAVNSTFILKEEFKEKLKELKEGKGS